MVYYLLRKRRHLAWKYIESIWQYFVRSVLSNVNSLASLISTASKKKCTHSILIDLFGSYTIYLSFFIHNKSNLNDNRVISPDICSKIKTTAFCFWLVYSFYFKNSDFQRCNQKLCCQEGRFEHKFSL